MDNYTYKFNIILGDEIKMEKLFICHIIDESYIIFPKILRRLMGLTIGEHLYVYQTEDGIGYILSCKNMDFHLIGKSITEAEGSRDIKLQLPKQIISDLAWKNKIFAQKQNKGACILLPTKPHCAICHKILNISDLYSFDNIDLCSECYKQTTDLSEPIPDLEQIQNIFFNQFDIVLEDQHYINGDELFKCIFNLEQQDEYFRNILFHLENFMIELEKYYEAPRLEIMRISLLGLVKAVSEYFYSLGCKNTERTDQ